MSGSTIVVDGLTNDWAAADRLGFPTNWVGGYEVYGRIEGGKLLLALVAPVAIDINTTIWLNTDQDAGTGFQIFGNTGGAEFAINLITDLGLPAPYLYAGNPVGAPIGPVTHAFGNAGKVLEMSLDLAAIATPGDASPATNLLIDVNDTTFVPGDYGGSQYTVAPSGSNGPALKVAIVYSETTAYKFFGGDAAKQIPSTAYSQLFASAQNQAAMAGVPFDILTEADLTDISKLSQYDSIIFPSISHVDSAKVGAITTALTSAVYDYGVGLITAGNFMTNDETGAAITGDSYIRLKQLMGLQLLTSDGTLSKIEVNATASTNPIMDGLADGELLRTYTNVFGAIGTQTFGVLNDVPHEVLATQTTTDLDTGAVVTTNAIFATVTGGRNVHFATEGMLADNNLLSRALDWVVSNPVAPEVRLEMSRHTAIFASRNDMDQSQEYAGVNPDGNAPGIYDAMLPILEAWKAKYNFVGSYYLNVGNDYGPEGSLAGDQDLADGMGTDWAVSNPYYQRLLALGNELGSHSYSHPFDTNLLDDAQLQKEFLLSKQVLEANIPGLSIAGAAIPGMPQSTSVSLKVLDYYTYLTGGNAMVGAGYPGAFGYLTPDTSKGVYLAPNISSDFSLTGFGPPGIGPLSIDDADEWWLQEWNEAIRLADLPVVVFPWHDYGLTGWNTDYGNPNGQIYGNEAMFTPLIEAAFNYGAEFVTLADLAARIAAFEQATLSTTFDQAANTVTASVTGALGTFQLELDGPIARVQNWYAYDNDSVFLPVGNTTLNITLGATPDDVTRIVELPARGQLLSVTGNGTDLAFTLNGEGSVMVDLRDYDAVTAGFRVTGAAATVTNGMMELSLNGTGTHNVSLTYEQLVKITTGGVTSYVMSDIYSGPVSWLERQFLGSADGDVMIGTARNEFLNSGAGMDAIDGGGGDDVIDGGTGSNFLSGGAGRDDFFLDGRGGMVTWSTITDWEAGERLSVWGWKPGVSQATWVENAGAAGYTGVTMHGDLDGNGVIDTSVTWTGMTRAQLQTPIQMDGLLWFA